jgi:hypothetical protein
MIPMPGAGVTKTFMPFPNALQEEKMDKTPLEGRALKKLLIKCRMTHDAMWFYHCLQECGIEK